MFSYSYRLTPTKHYYDVLVNSNVHTYIPTHNTPKEMTRFRNIYQLPNLYSKIDWYINITFTKVSPINNILRTRGRDKQNQIKINTPIFLQRPLNKININWMFKHKSVSKYSWLHSWWRWRLRKTNTEIHLKRHWKLFPKNDELKIDERNKAQKFVRQ